MRIPYSNLFSAAAGLALFASTACAAPVMPATDSDIAHAGIRPELDNAFYDSHGEAATPKHKPHAGPNAAPLLSASNADTTGLDSHYIIVLQPDLSEQEFQAHTNWVSEMHQMDIASQEDEYYDTSDSNYMFGLKHVYDFGEDSFKGYSGQFSSNIVEQIRLHPHVIAVERDQVVSIKKLETQSGAPWGLARISHKSVKYDDIGKYVYDSSAGDNITAYVVDTGVSIHHVEFEGRASWGATIPSGDVDEDNNGHGTHVAGTIASRAYGVAKKAEIVAVKVLRSSGSGTMADVIAGVEWTVRHHKSSGKKTSVGNMSLGGGNSFVLDMAVDSAVTNGVIYAVAAGNEYDDACYSSPAASKKAITVGASTINDQMAYFSNYGSCVDIFAPGLNILSTWIGSNTSTNTISGTSMATPHVAGLSAYYLGLHPAASASEVKDAIIKMGIHDVLLSIPVGSSTINLLAFNGAQE
ncbi:vacuolar serine protease Isp6 [Schizosaccharomyces pombe]|uniref:Sexual differentiation process putative subtilase-type proteinase isp6 n=1 Tax=Schizosaccharomyces pombe (strain 972 / ATCC 24843) TaxID=284812 RepID=ISP6_SCHPO|nr:vacuolar serine protease Isp6 [Schizosaccharomyces pombe]P40903.1 RecName: Full=Sexual differentiation process putative subtilase-type proteinase isp6 [Schizosaccharomyces pombe 972h-]BAA03149.1 serine protease [Schizosaccharomyces pombe]CAB11474.1 vacuolar serine protease Isp6 [Schizosaccharomyces pombe]|eukprot:NP_593815.1 vacuolar serine protease Isp6 [Schizosaccharomyces pombe]